MMNQYTMTYSRTVPPPMNPIPTENNQFLTDYRFFSFDIIDVKPNIIQPPKVIKPYVPIVINQQKEIPKQGCIVFNLNSQYSEVPTQKDEKQRIEKQNVVEIEGVIENNSIKEDDNNELEQQVIVDEELITDLPLTNSDEKQNVIQLEESVKKEQEEENNDNIIPPALPKVEDMTPLQRKKYGIEQKKKVFSVNPYSKLGDETTPMKGYIIKENFDVKVPIIHRQGTFEMLNKHLCKLGYPPQEAMELAAKEEMLISSEISDYHSFLVRRLKRFKTLGIEFPKGDSRNKNPSKAVKKN